MPTRRFDVDSLSFLPENLFTTGFCPTVSALRADLIIVLSKHTCFHFVILNEFELFFFKKQRPIVKTSLKKVYHNG